jgi:formyl-CoA transferase
MANRAALVDLLTERLQTRTTDEWMVLFDEAGLPAGPVLNIAEALALPQAVARGMITETEHPLAGKVKGLGLPIRFSGMDEGARQASLPAPLLGQHTFEVLQGCGYTEQDIRRLQQENAVYTEA